jgi:hypothetical protein
VIRTDSLLTPKTRPAEPEVWAFAVHGIKHANKRASRDILSGFIAFLFEIALYRLPRVDGLYHCCANLSPIDRMLTKNIINKLIFKQLTVWKRLYPPAFPLSF